MKQISACIPEKRTEKTRSSSDFAGTANKHEKQAKKMPQDFPVDGKSCGISDILPSIAK